MPLYLKMQLRFLPTSKVWVFYKLKLCYNSFVMDEMIYWVDKRERGVFFYDNDRECESDSDFRDIRMDWRAD